MAGQFAKPRSAATEVRDGVELPSYRGDAVNGLEFTAAARTPDPERLLEAYHCSAVTLNLCRAFAGGGYADLRQVHAWNQDFVAASPAGQRYERLAGEIDRAIAFMHACGANPEQFRAVEFYSSHAGRCCWIMSGPWSASTRVPASAMTSRRICCGSASAPAIAPGRTWPSHVPSAIPWP